MKTMLVKLFFIIAIIALPLVSYCQPEAPGGEVDAPLDGGISILIAAGVGYGLKKVRDERGRHKSNQQKNDPLS